MLLLKSLATIAKDLYLFLINEVAYIAVTSTLQFPYTSNSLIWGRLIIRIINFTNTLRLIRFSTLIYNGLEQRLTFYLCFRSISANSIVQLVQEFSMHRLSVSIIIVRPISLVFSLRQAEVTFQLNIESNISDFAFHQSFTDKEREIMIVPTQFVKDLR